MTIFPQEAVCAAPPEFDVEQTLPDGTEGEVYDGHTLTLSVPGEGAVIFTITMGSLPNGIILNSTTGVISGTPDTETAGLYPITFLVLISTVFLHLYFERQRTSHLLLFLSINALIVLTRSLFHPLWFIIILIGLLIYDRGNLKRIFLCALFPLLLIGIVHFKNYVILIQNVFLEIVQIMDNVLNRVFLRM